MALRYMMTKVFRANNLQKIGLVIVLGVFLLYIYQRYSKNEHFSNIPSEDELSRCLDISIKDKAWKPWADCYQKYGGPDEANEFLKCTQQVKLNDESRRKKCLPELDVKDEKPSPASGDYDASATMFDLFSQIAPSDVLDSTDGTEGFVNEPVYDIDNVQGYDDLGTLYGSPYSKPYENFEDSGHQIARECMGDPYKTCKERYGTSAWQGYSQCLLTGEGLESP